MKLKLLDIDNFIKQNNIKEVKVVSIFNQYGVGFDPNGRWSEEIFGRIGSKDRKNKFGFIDLHTKIINPVLYNIIITLSPDFRKIILEKDKYILSTDKFIQNDNGDTGLNFFISNIENINFVKCAKQEKLAEAKYLEKNRNQIVTNKQLVIPAGIRDLSISQSQGKQIISEINELYEKCISLSHQVDLQRTDPELYSIFTTQIQKTCLQIFKWIENKVKGKQGLFRSTMLKKTIDYSARIVAVSDPDIPMGSIGIPWHTVLTLYQPFFFNYVYYKNKKLQSLIKDYLNIPQDENIYTNKLQHFGSMIIKTPEKFEGELKELLIKCAEEITEGKDILCKRDPVVARKNYYAGSIKVLPEGKAVVVNSLSVSPQSLDFDGDCLALLPVHTNEALEEAAKMNPAKNKAAWVDSISSEKHLYPLTLDSISSIYGATLR